MIIRDYIFLILLFFLAFFIWVRDLAWISSLDNTLPIILSLPLFIWLGWPWRFTTQDNPLLFSGLMICAIVFIIGVALNITFVLALSWTGILWYWLSSRLDRKTAISIRRLLILPILSFPWLALEGDAIGWWFRLSSARVTSEIFSLMGFDVLHEGTRIIVQGLPVGIGEPCSGINVLQSMLIAGSALAYIYLRKHPGYWLNIGLLISIAWMANTVRIVVVCIVALTLSPEIALGLFHTFGGWFVLFMMLCLTWTIFSLQARLRGKNTP
ncbi:MAG TPA: exosortase/archaeosortase family protein [Deltaproteobacteria bacterium]|nr:exosortase/archaeosortase family protein [Deltaproteobacteria bacterium]